MSRKKESLIDSLFDLLKVAPFWFGPILAGLFYLLFRFGLPYIFALVVKDPAFHQPIQIISVEAAPWVAIGIIVLWLIAEAWKLGNRFIFHRQTGQESIAKLSWKDFERLISEVFRRQGYVVEVIDRPAGDGGVDVRLTGRKETVLVQCKQWRQRQIGVKIVRELLGVVISEKADRGIVVTSGTFSPDALEFARKTPQIQLIDGKELAQLIHAAKNTSQSAPAPSTPQNKPAPQPAAVPVCPACGSAMVKRTARQGANAGQSFWGCPKFPACRGTRPVSA